jgi:hypothetical protein
VEKGLFRPSPAGCIAQAARLVATEWNVIRSLADSPVRPSTSSGQAGIPWVSSWRLEQQATRRTGIPGTGRPSTTTAETTAKRQAPVWAATGSWLPKEGPVPDRDRVVLDRRRVEVDKERIILGKRWVVLGKYRVVFVEIVPFWSALDRSKNRKGFYGR